MLVVLHRESGFVKGPVREKRIPRLMLADNVYSTTKLLPILVIPVSGGVAESCLDVTALVL